MSEGHDGSGSVGRSAEERDDPRRGLWNGLEAGLGSVPVEAVHHLQLAPQLLLGEVVQHAGVHQGLHEVGAVLRQPQAGQPLVTDPLVVHVPVGQRLSQRVRVRVKVTPNPNPDPPGSRGSGLWLR